jgi:RNA polymerase sigma-70 factor (ECF subfamily)
VESDIAKDMRMTAADVPPSGEQQLILEARAGSHRAFQSLVERHIKTTYNIAFSFVGDHDRAEDITQEVFIKVHSALSSFRGEAELGTWLYRITTNLSLNHLKQRNRKTERTVDIMDPDATSLATHDMHAEATDERAHIERALHQLPTLQRAVVILRHIDGLSTKQVSTILRCSEGTVKTHLFRGLKKLRSTLLFLQEKSA